MQKQAKIDFSNPKVKKIVWNLKHFNKEYKTAYNIFLSTLPCGIFLPLLGPMLMLIIYDTEACVWISLCCVSIACSFAFFGGHSAQKRLKENGYDGHYDPILAEFTKLRIVEFLSVAIDCIGILILVISYVIDVSTVGTSYDSEWRIILSSTIPSACSVFLRCFLFAPTHKIRKQLTQEAIASESENAPSEQIEETEQPQAGNPHAEAPQSAQSNFCTVCGNRITDPEALFCERCGRRLK